MTAVVGGSVIAVNQSLLWSSTMYVIQQNWTSPCTWIAGYSACQRLCSYLSPLNPPATLTTMISQLLTDHLGITCVPEVLTHCAPGPIDTHLHSTLIGSTSTHQTQISRHCTHIVTTNCNVIAVITMTMEKVKAVNQFRLWASTPHRVQHNLASSWGEVANVASCRIW